MGKGGREAPLTSTAVVHAAKDELAKDVLIGTTLYDVTAFKHPGGSIVKFLMGHGDATEAFEEFHGRSKKAQAMLRALPKKEAPPDVLAARAGNGRPDLTRGYAKLRAEFTAEGRFDPSASEIAYRLSEVLVMHAVGAYLLMATQYFWTGLVMLGIVSGRCGWLMHEAGHYSLTGVIKTDRWLQSFIYGFGCGMSAAWWRNQHNKHHATPQKLQHDVDLDTLPLVAFHAQIAAKAKGPILKAWLRMQGILFIPVSCVLVATGWQLYLHPRHALRTKKTDELRWMALRYAVFFFGLCRGLSWPQALGTYWLYNQVAASYIFTNFSLSHTHLPVTQADEDVHWVEYAANHTTNISPGLVCNWWMANLNFQIEHHLFPAMPQYQHKSISPRVKAFFEAHGLTYDVRPYFSCLGETLANLHEVGHSTDQKKED
mmetsp:Transcript_13040/g.38846  ORF Transcript_13040/g.38846 Transcript_13040/m.38846 type:complete len:429 (+) Transcript_13040:128-1414(+)|eukprot:CAMPEP_0119260848 /NCGR_PEP_ID=MMETSP1329-20130426/1089_1 /TAXON_ID=114041 /ORGANISM="Genus nov. species nov., Strain RCC1024" /LENGTH=428 /DNA_ID=CAMNT_0007260317 /DNA_START=83 /DNA_END=1369 /DNA_ORIENTATION=+